MTMQEAIRLFNNYLQSNHKQRTIDSYDYLLNRFERIYAERSVPMISTPFWNRKRITLPNPPEGSGMHR